jgi:glycine/D-amino acid oxidase-like deaminating enzyme
VTTTYWLDGSDPAPLRTPSDGRPDAIVIGGGVTGCACALRLAQSGARVRLHEAHVLGGGASGRNGGFALRGAAPAYDAVVASLGRESARTLMRLTERGLDRLEELADDAFRRVGSLRLAWDDAELLALEAEQAALRADGFAVEWVERLEPPLDGLYRGAILHPGDGAIHPGRWIRRLAERAAGAGAELLEGSPIDVETALREADVVVVAADGYTGALLPELAEVVRPTRGQVLATEPLPELRYARPHYARGGFDYWQQLADGTLVLGGQRDASLATEHTDVDGTTPAIQARLELLVRELTGCEPAITHRWSGIWGATPDGLPLVGRLGTREGVWLAGGYSGHGNVLGLVCGTLVAAAIGGEPVPELSLFDPSRFG